MSGLIYNLLSFCCKDTLFEITFASISPKKMTDKKIMHIFTAKCIKADLHGYLFVKRKI